MFCSHYCNGQIPQNILISDYLLRIIIPDCTYLPHSGNLVQPCNGQTNWFQISMPNNKDLAHVIVTVWSDSTKKCVISVMA